MINTNLRSFSSLKLGKDFSKHIIIIFLNTNSKDQILIHGRKAYEIITIRIIKDDLENSYIHHKKFCSLAN